MTDDTIERIYYGSGFAVSALITIGYHVWIIQAGMRGWL